VTKEIIIILGFNVFGSDTDSCMCRIVSRSNIPIPSQLNSPTHLCFVCLQFTVDLLFTKVLSHRGFLCKLFSGEVVG